MKELTGLNSFHLNTAPEPSVLALSTLGALVVLFRYKGRLS